MKLLAAVYGLALLASGAIAQTADLLSPANLPPTIKIADLGGFKAYRLKTAGDSGGMMGGGFSSLMMMGMMFSGTGGGGMMGGSGNPMPLLTVLDLSWTKNQTLRFGNADFLVTYRTEMSFPQGRTPPDKPTVALRLVLLRLDTLTSVEPMSDFTPEDLASALQKSGISEGASKVGIDLNGVAMDAAMMLPVVTQERHAAEQTSALSNVKQLAISLEIYMTDYDDNLPYVQDSASLKPILGPYAKNDELWNVPGNPSGHFLFNMSVAGVNSTQVEKPAETPMLYEDPPETDGTRAVAFLDGHARRVKPDDWVAMQPLLHLKLKRTSQPLPVKH